MGFFITLLIQVALAVITDLLSPKPEIEDAKPSGLGDFRFPTATEGRPIPMLWVTVKISGPNVVWYGDLEQEPITETVKTGLFSKDSVIRGFRYRMGIQFALCMGPDVEMTRVYINNKVVVDATGSPITHDTSFEINEPDLFGGEDLGSGGVVGTLRFFAGTSTQGVSSYLSSVSGASAVVSAGGSGYSVGDILTEAGDGTASTRATFRVSAVLVGVVTDVTIVEPGLYSDDSSNPAATTVDPSGGTSCTLTVTYTEALQDEGGDTPAYRDLCYVVPDFEHVLLGTSSNIKPWAFEVRRIPNGLGLTEPGEITVVGGANLANVLYELVTNTDWGRGQPVDDIDTDDFTAAAVTLAAEGNGFSFLLDRVEDLSDLQRRVEEQADGILFKDPITAKWKIKLARADYDVETVLEINEDNLLDLVGFNRGTWEGTSSEVRIPITDASDDYKSTFGFAQDMANVQVTGKNKTASFSHPGVKDSDLANAIAWRELRTVSVPLAVGTWIVDRTFYGVLPGDVVSFTDEDLNFLKLPVRVKDIFYGDLLNGRITIEGTQDVFFAAAGVFAPPPNTGWVAPGDTLIAFAADGQIAIEAPRALTARDPASSSPITDKIWAAARKQGPEATFTMVERNASGSPSGDFSELGKVFQFSLLGELLNDLTSGVVSPTASLEIVPNPDAQADVVAAFPSNTDPIDVVGLGTDLLTLCLINDEFILIESAEITGNNVQLNNVYRGVIDSVQGTHLAGAKVMLVFVGAGMSDVTITAGNNVDVKLLPKSISDTLAEGDATTISLTMSNRTRRPYAPASFDLNGNTFDDTLVDLDGSGSGEDVGILVDEIVRRDFRTVDEIEALSTDAGTLFADFPAENTTTVEVDILDDVTLLTSTTGISGTSTTMRQLDILAGLDTTSLPASLTVALRQSHTFDAVVYASREDFSFVFTVDSPFVGKHAFGELDDSEISNIYEVQSGDDSIDHVFALSTAFTLGDVEYRLDGGSFLTLITAGGTGGTIPNASLSVGTDIEIRHLSPDSNPQKLLAMTVGGTEEAYAVLIS